MTVLVTGGRDYENRAVVFAALDALKPARVVHGDYWNGADAAAREWVELRGVPDGRYPADWKAQGKAAGPMRNSKMIATEKPNLCLAFPGGRGTADCVEKCEKAGIEVRKIAVSD